MVPLEDLQKYCLGKKIIIVGNSSSLLNGNNRRLIDSYDIVVRINKGYQHTRQLFDEYIGSKTDILSIGIKSAHGASTIIKGNSVPFIISPIIYSDKLDYPNVYNVDYETYVSLQQSLSGSKPSTGISTYNFFNKLIDFTRLDLIGFDFFESSTRQRNQFGHIKVNDHDGIKEMNFFETSKDPSKTTLHKTKGGNSFPNNTPRFSNTKQFFIKNNRRA
jgi:hypothetical protein